MLDILKIENKYKKSLEKIEEWSYLRNYYREAKIESKISKKTVLDILKNVKFIFYGFFNWFKKYDYIIFSDSSERKNINNTLFDIKADPIYKKLNNILIVETPSPKHYPRSKIFTNKIVSRRFIDLITFFLEKFAKRYDYDILNKINKEYNIPFNYSKQIQRFNTQYKIYKFWFKLVRPKIIFLNCFYDKQYIIKAANELGIKTVDIQHGLIGTNHTAYYSELNLNKQYYPTYLFLYGEIDKKNLQKSKIFKSDNCYVIGNFYLEYLMKNFKEDQKFLNIKKKYKLTIGVSLQWTVEQELIDFINSVSKELTEILFVLIPRRFDKKYLDLDLNSNVIFYPFLNCYEIIMHCDYHCTVYSSCALESPSLGIKNILVNFNKLSNKFILHLLNNKNSYVINSKKEFIKTVNNLKHYKYNKTFVIKSNEYIFKSNYCKNLDYALYHIEGKKYDK